MACYVCVWGGGGVLCVIGSPCVCPSVQEPNNLANKHAYKFSSVQRKTVGVRSSAGNKGIDLITKRTKCEQWSLDIVHVCVHACQL